MVRKIQLFAFTDIQTICIGFLLLSVALGAVQYYPAPQVTTTTIGPISKSVIGDRWIGSKRIETLQITQDINAEDGQDQTTFLLKFYDRPSNGYLTDVKLVKKGKWSYIKGTAETLSCSAIYEEKNEIYGLLSFNIAKKQLKIVLEVPFTTIKEHLSPNDPLDKATLESLATIGDNCEAGVFGTTYIRQVGGFTDVSIVKLPAEWNPVQITEDYKYAIYGDKLYKYKADLATYDPIYSFASTFNEYDLRVNENRIIVSASNNDYIVAKDSYSVHQSFFIIQDLPAGVKEIKIVTYDGVSKNKHFDFFASPKLTKLGLYYLPATAASEADVVLVGFNIDYTAYTTTNLVFVQPLVFMSAAKASNNMFDFSDRFILVRNNDDKVDLAFQFVGSQVRKFASRDLTYEVKLLASSERIYIDSYYNPYLVAISYVKEANGGYSFDRTFYANYAATVRVKLPPTPPLVKFEKPTQSIPLDFRRYEGLQFSYIDVDGANSIVNKRILKIGQADNLISYSTTFNDIKLRATTGNPNCMIATEGTEAPYTYYFLKFNPETKKFGRLNLVALIGSETFTLPSKGPVVSDTCDMISINQKIYYADTSEEFKPIGNDLANFNWVALDNSFVYAYTKGFIWKFNSATKKYDNIYTFPTVLDHNYKQIFSSGNKFIMYALDPTFNYKSYFFAALRQDNSKITYIGDDQVFDSPLNIEIQVSQDVTKVLLYDASYPIAALQKNFYAWNINYTPLIPNAVKKYPFTVSDFLTNDRRMVYQLFNDFIYIRQVGIPFSDSNRDQIGVQFLYNLKGGDLKLISKRSNSIKERDDYTKSTTIVSQNSKYYVCNIQIQVDAEFNRFLVVPFEEFLLGLSNLDDKSPVTGLIRDGQIYLCEPGCSDCSSGTCVSCKDGYILDSVVSVCKKCAPGCKGCDPLDINKCNSCFDGLYRDASSPYSCTACNANCATCSFTSANCVTCVPQMFLTGGQVCEKCPKYCIQCSDASTCKTCRNGFVLTASNQCRSCSIQCTECLINAVTICSSCSSGLQFKQGKCVPCPTSCVTCKSGVCSQCASGYILTDAKACVQACQLPCATCVTSQPSNCTSCYGSAILAEGKCSVSTTCNDDSSCSECGQGLNHYLDTGKCIKCPDIQSCIQCGPSDSTTCTLCIEGYYVNSAGSCTECGLGCKTCASEAGCNVCQLGFLLPANSGVCLKCIEPCLTCDSTPAYCTSCMEGYFRRGWKCLPEKYLGFSLAFPSASSITSVDVILDQIIAVVLTAINEDVNNIDIVTILSMVSGSVQVSAAVVPPAGITATTASQITAGLSGTTTFGGLTSGSLSVSVFTAPVNGGGSSSSSDSGSSDNAGMIAGIVIGSVAFVGIVLAIIYCVYIAKKSNLLIHSAESSNIIQENKESIQVESFDGMQAYNFGQRNNGK